jgi:protein involved in polysaccharide export with SLBB domain
MVTWRDLQIASMRPVVLFRTCAAVAALVGASTYSLADSLAIVPQTKLRVTVVQWIPLKGEYRNWDAVSGEFTVNAIGEISLPLIGPMRVVGSDSGNLASKISDLIKARTGLIDPPNTTVQVVEYPPVYVVGAVKAPGAYVFRPGLTVLQALALSGGEYRPSGTEDPKGMTAQISLLGELRAIRDDILRATGLVARLKAEFAGDKEVRFPPELAAASGNPLATETMSQEQVIFSARATALTRQLDNYAELQELLRGEVEILGQKTVALERNIKLVEDELSGVKSLVERGMATVSRRSELERVVAELHSRRLDEVTAAMRARQSLSETTRNEQGLRDKQHTDVSAELQEAQVSLERLRIKEDVITKTLVLADASELNPRSNVRRGQEQLSFAITRRAQERDENISATEATILLPGDVVKVFVGNETREGPDLAEARSTQ